jgi:hypothetical protein
VTKLPKTTSFSGSQTTNKSKALISSLAPPNSKINLSTFYSPPTSGSTLTIEQYTSTVLVHLKQRICKLLRVKKVKADQKTTLLKLTNYYDLQNKQSLLLQINLSAYLAPLSYKKVCFLEFPDNPLQKTDRFLHHWYPRENNPHHHHHHKPLPQAFPTPHRPIYP